MTLSSRVGVMTDGRIVQTGTPREVYEYPQSRFVAGFIGSVNLFEGRISEDEVDHVVITCDRTGAQIMVAHGMACTMGQRAAVAIRPEKITLSRSPLPDLPNRLTGTVEGVGYLGNLSVYRVAVAGGMVLRVAQSNRTRAGDDLPQTGDAVHLGWGGSDAVVLLT